MSSIEQLVHATARIAAADRTGTGFFVAPGLIATCGHVAGDTGSAVTVHGWDGTALAGMVIDCARDADVALIEVVGSCSYPALELDDATEFHRGKDWLAYGFPRIAKSAPVLIEGTIRMVTTRDSQGRASLQLYSEDSAAGKGAYLDGFSGSALVLRGRVIGQLRTTPKDLDGASQLGLIFAAPSAPITALLRRVRPGLVQRTYRDPQPPNAPYDPTWYVHRPIEEARAAADLDARKPVVLAGPQFFGKSSLLQCIVESARNREKQRGRDARIAEIDLGVVGVVPAMDLKAFFPLFFEAILRSLGLVPDEHIERYVSNGGMTGPSAAALLRELLGQSEDPLYLVLSRTEALIYWPQLDAFAQWLRSWATPRSANLRLLAEFSTAPALVTERIPSFNVAPEPIIIKDFARSQVLELAALYGLNWGDAEVDSLCAVIGGHPYLVRCALFEAARAKTAVAAIIEAAHDDGGVFREFLQANLDHIHKTKSLREAACSIACGKPPPPHPPDAVDKLVAAGIVRRGRTIRDLSPAYPLFGHHLQAMCVP